MVSRHMSLVSSMSAMPKPWTSVDDDPRPVPNSKRFPVRWSSSATFSATRTGLFTGGVLLAVAEVDGRRDVEEGRAGVDPLGLRGAEAEERLRSGHVAVLVEEVVLRAPHVLEATAVRGLGDLHVAEDALVLRIGVGRSLRLGDEQLGEDAELHGGCSCGPSDGSRCSDPMSAKL